MAIVTIIPLPMPFDSQVRDEVLALAAQDMPFDQIEARLVRFFPAKEVLGAIAWLKYQSPDAILRWMEGVSMLEVNYATMLKESRIALTLTPRPI